MNAEINSKTELKIIELEEELRVAMIEDDVKKLDELIADSLIFTTPFGNTITKQMDLDIHSTKVQKISTLSPSEQTVQIYGSCAVVTVRMDTEGTYGDIPINGAYRYTRVWAKTNDDWKVIAGAVVAIQG